MTVLVHNPDGTVTPYDQGDDWWVEDGVLTVANDGGFQIASYPPGGWDSVNRGPDVVKLAVVDEIFGETEEADNELG